MTVQIWTYLIVGSTFAIYIGIALWAKASSSKEFYVAGGGVSPLANGMATAADWMSAVSFLGLAGIISLQGRDGGIFLMGWTGGYVLLALFLAPYLRKFGKFTVPDFIGDRYYSQTARLIAVICAIFISFTYVAGQMRGVGIVFARFLEVPINTGVFIGMGLVFFYAVLGGMKGITYTQVAQYCILIFAFTVPAIFISLLMTGNPIPQLGFGGKLLLEPETTLLDKLDGLNQQLGFSAYTDGNMPTSTAFILCLCLMAGTAGLPHVIVRFFTVPKIADARSSAGIALALIVLMYTLVPAVAVFARTNLLQSVVGEDGTGKNYEQMPEWFYKYEESELIAWVDKNGDGKINHYKGNVFEGIPEFKYDEQDNHIKGAHGQLLLNNPPSESPNELYVDGDIMVLANPEIAKLPDWVIALVAAGALAAALSTAAGLLLVISSSIAHDLLKKMIAPNIDDKGELRAARISAFVAVLIAGYMGINPPGFVAETVAYAFGIAAATFFPSIVLGIFTKSTNKAGAISGLIVGLVFTVVYIVAHKLSGFSINDPFGNAVHPMGVGTIGMVLNFMVAIIVSKFTAPVPEEVKELVENIRVPNVKN